jgi:NADH-quinone oxidoreductase subunit G
VAKIIVDGKEHECEEGQNLFQAIKAAKGKALPHFCYHPGLSVAGVCRMCQVEIEGVPRPVIACNAQVKDGMELRTETDRVSDVVQQILNFHLLHHPVDCPVCDQAGECALQDQYMNYGLYEASADIEDKIEKGKVKPIGEQVMLDAERCVLCARCTRFTSEITKTHEMGIFNRGNHAEVGVAPGQTLDNNYSLNTVDICPVGALTSRDFRFKQRVWWLETTASVCAGCATGCNMTIGHCEGTVYRYKPRPNADVNSYWMCDEGRLMYHRLAAEDRLMTPAVASEEGPSSVGWDEAYARVQGLLRGDDGMTRRFVIIGSAHATVEELHALGRFADAVGGTKLGFRLSGSEMGEADDLLVAADRTPNAEGARRLGWTDFDLDALRAQASGQAVLLLLKNDLAAFDEDAAQVLSGYAGVIALTTHQDATADLADIALPVSSYAETDGIFVNAKGRAQALNASIEGPADARNAVVVLRELARLCASEFAWNSPLELRQDLTATQDSWGVLAGGIDPKGVGLDDAAGGAAVGIETGSEGGGE